MSPFVSLAAILWIPAVFIAFGVLPPRRAILFSIIGGWMFLPVHQFSFTGLPDMPKAFFVGVPPLIAALARFNYSGARFRLDIIDLVLLGFCLAPSLSSLVNNLGSYDAMSAFIAILPLYICPYVLGRMYFGDADGFRDFMWAMLIGGLIYAPLCLYEIVMSPQLHRIVYGFHQKEIIHSVRGGTWRPDVFMHTGLMLGMFMMMSCLCGFVLWRQGELRKARWMTAFVPPGMVLAGLVAVFVAGKSMGAIVLFAVGCVAVEITRRTRSRLALFALVLIPAVTLWIRLMPTDYEDGLVGLIHQWNPTRAASLEFRFDNEALLFERAMEKPLFGWGRHGAGFIYDDSGMKTSVTDSFWIIQVNAFGIISLILGYILILLPVLRLLLKLPEEWWKSEVVWFAVAASMLLPLYGIDSLVNDMRMPIYLLVAGGVVSCLSRVRQSCKVESPSENPVIIPNPAVSASFRYI